MEMGAYLRVIWVQCNGLADDENGAFGVAHLVMQFGQCVQIGRRVWAQAQGPPR